jgi:nicotinate-nucleotide adenylyltransferase
VGVVREAGGESTPGSAGETVVHRKERKPMKIGVFGGTFDPPHLGHLVAAQEVHFRLGLDRVLWIPAGIPPHKRDQEITPGPVRLEMVRAAIAGDPRFEANDVEIRRPGPSYTVETLRQLRDRGPDDELFLILGADQLAELDGWREPDEIRRLATVVGFGREGDGPGQVAGARIVRVPRLDVSSTEVRRRMAAGEPVTYLVPEGVEAIVRSERLYGRFSGF